MSDVDNKLTLENIGGGVAGEKFARELALVLENVLDPNTEPDAKREITLKFKFTPNDDRERMTISITADTKLAGTKAHGSLAYLGRVDNEPCAVEYDPKQGKLFDVAPVEAPLKMAPPTKGSDA